MTVLRERIERLMALNFGKRGVDVVASGVLLEVLQEVEELHAPTKYGACRECRSQRWPCRTLGMLDDPWQDSEVSAA